MSTEKRTVLAIVLMLATVVLVNVLFPPARPQPSEQQAGAPQLQETAATPTAAEAATETVEETRAVRPQPLPTPADTLELPAAATAGVSQAEDTVWVTGPLYRFGFAQRGGRLVSAVMSQFESLAEETKGQALELIPAYTENYLTHQWLVGDDTLDLRGAQFEIEPANGLTMAAGSPRQSLRLTYNHPGTSFRVELDYSFQPDSYVVHLEGRLIGGPTRGWWAIDLGSGMQSNEWDPEEDYEQNLAFAARGVEGVLSEKIADVAAGERITLDGPFDWVAVRTKYFLTALVVPDNPEEDARFAGLMISGLQEPFRADGLATFPVSRQGDFARKIYIGPQDYGRLKAVHHDLDQVAPYGYRWLQPVLRPLAGAITTLLVWMHRFFGLNYGWILIIFGVGIRIILFPLYQKSMRSQMETMRVQPLMKEIQERHKNDPQKLQQEMMKLYKEHKINPLGGCLPMLLPFPILIALFFVFRDTIEFRGVSFFWLPDLSRADPYYIIPVLMGLSMFLLQWVGQRSMPQGNPQMKMMMWIMPIMLTVLFANFASGLNLYYATMNVASLPQQLYLAKERKAAAAQPPPSKKPPGKPSKKHKT
jgi:YidC/Oxa1 family membrane protein insertase